jgi:hypothetical protein
MSDPGRHPSGATKAPRPRIIQRERHPNDKANGTNESDVAMTTAIKPSTNGHGQNGRVGLNTVKRLAETLATSPLEPSATAAPASPPKAEGRDAPSGRFTVGNRFGKGNPHARRMAGLRQAFLSTATEERMRELGEKLFAAARGGDWQAAKLFLLFVVGRPAAAVNPDTLDRDEWQGREWWDEMSTKWFRKISFEDTLRIAKVLSENGPDGTETMLAPADMLLDLTSID